jgi:uncharacterized membrane protein
MGAPTAYPMPPMMAAEPPEVQSIKSMLHIVRILAIIFGILLFLGGVAYAAFLAWAFSVCGTFAAYCGGSLGFALVPAILIIIFGVIDFVIYMQMKEIEAMVNQHQYEQAKSKTLLWMILGFILGGIILGVLLLIAYLKFDPVITWQRNQQQGGVPPGFAPQYMAPPPQQYAPPAPMAAPPPAAPPPAAAPAAPMCAKCGKPTTYIAQNGRYYCYTDNLYV